MLSVCVLGMVAGIMRFYSFLAVRSFEDITYEAVQPLCWTIAESGIYLVAGVMPTLRPLVRKVVGDVHFDKLLSRSSWSSGNRSSKRGGHVLLKGESLMASGKMGTEASEVECKEGGSGRTSRNEDEERGVR